MVACPFYAFQEHKKVPTVEVEKNGVGHAVLVPLPMPKGYSPGGDYELEPFEEGDDEDDRDTGAIRGNINAYTLGVLFDVNPKSLEIVVDGGGGGVSLHELAAFDTGRKYWGKKLIVAGEPREFKSALAADQAAAQKLRKIRALAQDAKEADARWACWRRWCEKNDTSAHAPSALPAAVGGKNASPSKQQAAAAASGRGDKAGRLPETRSPSKATAAGNDVPSVRGGDLSDLPLVEVTCTLSGESFDLLPACRITGGAGGATHAAASPVTFDGMLSAYNFATLFQVAQPLVVQVDTRGGGTGGAPRTIAPRKDDGQYMLTSQEITAGAAIRVMGAPPSLPADAAKAATKQGQMVAAKNRLLKRIADEVGEARGRVTPLLAAVKPTADPPTPFLPDVAAGGSGAGGRSPKAGGSRAAHAPTTTAAPAGKAAPSPAAPASAPAPSALVDLASLQRELRRHDSGGSDHDKAQPLASAATATASASSVPVVKPPAAASTQTSTPAAPSSVRQPQPSTGNPTTPAKRVVGSSGAQNVRSVTDAKRARDEARDGAGGAASSSSTTAAASASAAPSRTGTAPRGSGARATKGASTATATATPTPNSAAVAKARDPPARPASGSANVGGPASAPAPRIWSVGANGAVPKHGRRASPSEKNGEGEGVTAPAPAPVPVGRAMPRVPLGGGAPGAVARRGSSHGVLRKPAAKPAAPKRLASLSSAGGKAPGAGGVSSRPGSKQEPLRKGSRAAGTGARGKNARHEAGGSDGGGVPPAPAPAPPVREHVSAPAAPSVYSPSFEQANGATDRLDGVGGTSVPTSLVAPPVGSFESDVAIARMIAREEQEALIMNDIELARQLGAAPPMRAGGGSAQRGVAHALHTRGRHGHNNNNMDEDEALAKALMASQYDR